MKQPNKPFSIHFVCRGNVHRSRLAEAYMKRLALEGFTISSSGVEASFYPSATRSRFTEMVLKHQPELRKTMSPARVQTTPKLLEAPDVVICLDKSVYDDAVGKFGLDPRKTQVWHVEDIDKRVVRAGTTVDDDDVVVDLEDDIFARIRRECNQLVKYLTGTAWVDVVDANNHPTGLRLPMGWVTDRGFWHRGVHVVARTADGKYVVGKRANSIVFSPGMLEISLGGGIDTGETPLRAAQRETHEEIGVHLPEKRFRPLFMHTKDSYHPHYNKRTRAHVYVFTVTLPIHSERLHAQPSEVAEVQLLTQRQVKHMLRAHRMEHFGRLLPAQRLYRKAIAYSALPF